ncbi:MAG TPA: hypothetical protein VGT61_11195 [Thermomicrobiales bacterium]|jgi:hypothetical protein|nr:hypothetical protein [Thermomicrobiales bacterium]
MPSPTRPVVRLPVVLLALLVLVGGLGMTPGAMAQTGPAVSPFDLAALLPGIRDLEEAGLADMVGGSPIDLDSIDAYTDWSGGGIPDTVEGLRAAGFVRHYGVSWIDEASETDYRETGAYAPVTQVETYAYQFTDPAGAGAGFNLLEEGSAPLEGVTIPLGDWATASSVPPVEYTDGTTATGLDLTARLGTIGIGISVITRDMSPSRGAELDIATLLLTEAVAAIQALGTPPMTGPGLEAARFAGTASGYQSGFYVIRGGQSAWAYAAEPADQREAYTAEEVATGLVSQYAIYQYLETATGGFYEIYTYAATYGTPEQARAVVESATAPAENYAITPLVGAPTFGDISSAWTLNDPNGTTFESYVTWASGASVYTVRVGLPNRQPAPAAVYAIATAQAGCLVSGTCWRYQPIPDGVITDASALA